MFSNRVQPQAAERLNTLMSAVTMTTRLTSLRFISPRAAILKYRLRTSTSS